MFKKEIDEPTIKPLYSDLQRQECDKSFTSQWENSSKMADGGGLQSHSVVSDTPIYYNSNLNWY